MFSRFFAHQRNSSKNKARRERRPQLRRLKLQALEDRCLLATFADAGSALNLNLPTNQQVAILSTGATYQLSLGSTGTWSGSNDANVTGNGTSTLTVTNAGISAFTSAINITDTGSGGGDAVTFSDSLPRGYTSSGFASSGYANNFVITLTSAVASPGLAFNGTSVFLGGSALTASVSGAINVNAGASVRASGGAISLAATGAVTVGLGATVNSGTGTLTLAADVKSNGAGDNGTGTLTISADATVTSSNSSPSAITLRGADVSIDTSSNPAVVGATRLLSSSPIFTYSGLDDDPQSMVVDSSGNLYVADALNNIVSKFAPGSTTVSATYSGFSGPSALAVDFSGNLYVANGLGSTVNEFTPGSTVASATYSAGISNPTALAFDSSGNLYVANDTHVSKFAPGSTTVSATYSGFSDVTDLAFDSSGNLYVADVGIHGTVTKFAPGSTVASATYTAGISEPQELAIDSSGDLYVWGDGQNSVTEYAAGSTAVSATYTNSYSQITGMAVDSGGNLFVVTYGADGSEASEFAPGSTTASATFFAPEAAEGALNGITLDSSGNLYVNSPVSNAAYKFTQGAGAVPTAGGVVIQSSVESRPMLIGGTNSSPVAGINLSTAELAQIFTTSAGTVTIGDSNQTGNITFSTATPVTTAGAALRVIQSTSGAGQIILDDGAGTGTALNGNGGSISLTAGSGGIAALAASNSAAEIATSGATVTLLTSGPIGTSTNRIQFGDNSNAAQQDVVIGSAVLQPSSVYLDGLGSLTLGNVLGGTATTTIDVTARTDLVVAASATINSGTSTLSLGADLTAAKAGDDGSGTLTISAGAIVTSANTSASAITLRGADVSIDTSSNPALVGVTPQLGTFGASSATLSGLNKPEGLVFDSSGNLYVANYLGNSVSVFAPGSTTPTATLAGLDEPGALAFDSGGSLYVANQGNNTVSEFAPGRTSPRATYSGLSGPSALAIDSSGNLYVANETNNTVSKFAAGSTSLAATYSVNASPLALAFDSSGDLYVASYGGSVLEFPPGSTTSNASYAAGNGADALAFDSGGNLYVANSTDNKVFKFAQGNSAANATYATGSYPQALAFDSSGNLYALNAVDSTVSKFAPGSTTASATYSSGLSTPEDLAFDSRGDLFVTNYGNSTLSQFSPTTAPTAGGVVIQSSVESRPIQIGTNNAPLDPGFETPALSAGSFQYDPTGSPWTFSGTAGVSSNGSGFTGSNPNAPEGTQVALLQETGSVSQSFALSAGTYSISLDAAQRNDAQAGQTFEVLVDNNVVGTITPSGTSYSSYNVGTFTVTGTAPHTIELLGLNPHGGDNTAFIDQVSIVVHGINLNSAELAQIFTTSTGTVTVGDSAQTGNITFSTATPATTAGAALSVIQSTGGAGQIILDDGSGSGTGLNGNGGLVTLTPGTGGIQTTLFATGTPLASKGFTASGKALNLALGFAPTVGAQLTVVNNTATPAASNLISGAFSNVAQGSTVTLSYLGSNYNFQASYQGGDGNDLVLTNVKGATTTSVAASPSPSTYGQSVTFTATVTSGGSPATSGSVTFEEGSTVLASNVSVDANGHAAFSISTLSVAASPHTITALYSGTSQLYTSSGTASQTVNKAHLTVTANSTSRLYGAADPTFTATISGFVNSETLATSGVTGSAGFTSNDTTTSPVGTYTITAAIGTLAATNYDFTTFNTGTLMVNPVALTITAPSLTLAYGAALPTLTPSYSGFVNGDSPASLTTAPTITVTATTTAGSYQTSASGAVDPNYTISYVPGTLTVTAPPPALAATSLVEGAASGSDSDELAEPLSMAAWTAVANATWLHVAPASASGAGSATIGFNFDANTTNLARTGTITIAGQTLTVTQAPANYAAASSAAALASGLAHATGVAVDASGNLYFADTGNNAIEERSSTTGQITTLVSGLSEPNNVLVGVAVDASGNVYFADANSHAIKERSSSTEMVTTLVSTGLNTPQGVAVDGAGNVYFADSGNNTIQEWGPLTGAVTTLVSGLNGPTGIAVDGAGNVYFADTLNHAVKEWSPSTNLVTPLVSSGLSTPTGVAVDGSGNVYIADSANDAMDEWSAATDAVTSLLPSGQHSPVGLAVDSGGDVYFADALNEAISELARAYVGPVSTTISAAAGSGSLGILPPSQTLTGPFAPISDSSWLTIGTTSRGQINYSFTANTSSNGRTANITVLGQQFAVTQLTTLPPALAIGGPAVTYNTGGGPIVVAPAATLNTGDGLFAGAVLTVTNTTGGGNDLIKIGSSGLLTASGGTLTFNGTAVGTYNSGGAFRTPLVITFNSSATQAAVLAVTQNVQFLVIYPNSVSLATRTVTFQLTDGEGQAGATVSQTVLFTAPPTLAIGGPAVTYNTGGGPIAVAPAATLSSGDGLFGGSVLTVTNITGGGNDLVKIGSSGLLTASGGTLTYNGTVVGTYNSGGAYRTPLVITFNSSATQAAILAVTQNVQFLVIYPNSVSLATRTVTFQLTDGGGNAGATVSQTVLFTAPPTLAIGGPSVTYNTGGGPIAVAPVATLSIGDGLFAGSVLTVTNITGGGNDLLTIGSSGLLTASGGTLTYNGTAVGTYNSGGAYRTPLVISFNSSATQAAVLAVTQNVLFTVIYAHSVSLATRSVTFQLTDGGGNAGATVTQSVLFTAPPTLAINGPAVNYSSGTAPIAVAPLATLSTGDGAFANSLLSVSDVNGGPSDLLSVQSSGLLAVSGNTLTYNGVAIGSFTSGSSGTPLLVTFNANATQAAILAVAQNITFSTLANPPTGTRTLNFQLTDGAGNTSAIASQFVQVT